MSRIQGLFHRLRVRILGERYAREQEDELRFHLELDAMHIARDGELREEAAYAARRRLGNLTAVREQLRRAAGFEPFDLARQELTYAWRALRRSPVFTFVIVITLSIGIGANTAVIGIIDTAFLRKLPVPDPERVIAVYSGDTRSGGRAPARGSNSFPDFLELRTHVEGVEDLAAYAMTSLKLGDTLSGTEAWSALVSGNYFSVMGIRAARGRLILPDEEQPLGSYPVVVISDALWNSRFGRDERIVGQELAIGGGRFTIIGVTPPGFTGTHPEGRTDLWLPWTMESEATGRPPIYQNRDARAAMVIGRLSVGSNLSRVQLSLDRAARDLAARWPALDGSLRFRVVRNDRLVSIAEVPFAFESMLIFWAMVFLLHTVACSNVASLVLARAAARRQELGIRLCLGASRRRIMMHALAEPALLALAGAAGGVMVARWLTLIITRMQFLSAMDSGLDVRVLAIAALAAAATVLVFGLAPALEASRPDPLATLRGLSSARAKGRHRDAAPVIMVGQVALSVILLVNAAVLARTFDRQRREDPGFDASHLLVASVELRGRPANWGTVDQSVDAMLSRVAAMPGVRRVAVSGGSPLLKGAGWVDEAVVAGHHYADDESRKVSMQVVGPGYFATIGATMARGREFTAIDRASASNPVGQFDAVVVNEAMARRFWPNEDPLGRQLAFRNRGSATVVGVVRDYHDVSLSAVIPRAYFPILEWRIWPSFELMVQTAGEPAPLEHALHAAIASSSMPMQPPVLRTMRDLMDQSLDVARKGGIAMSICAAVALLLTGIGLYGLVASLTAQRRREIGIRLALGARAANVHLVLLGGIGRLVAAGAVVGLACAAAMVRIERGLWGPSIMVEATPLVAALAILAAVVAVAAFIPSRRATMSDPAEVLRTE